MRSVLVTDHPGEQVSWNVKSATPYLKEKVS